MMSFPLSGTTFDKEGSQWQFTIGARGSSSTGISESNISYNPFVRARFIHEYFSISPGIHRFIHFQTTDGYSDYDYIDFNQAVLDADIILFDHVIINGVLKYAEGESAYQRKEYLVEISFDYQQFILIGEYSRGKTEYQFDTLDVEIENSDYFAEVDYLFSDSMSIDLSYTYSSIRFKNLENTYVCKTFRIGTMPEIFDRTYIIAGVSLGVDSDEYMISGFDGGLNISIGSHLKLLFLYLFSYYHAPDQPNRIESTEQPMKGKEKETEDGNPYLSEDLRGESFSTHRVSLVMSCTF